MMPCLNVMSLLIQSSTYHFFYLLFLKWIQSEYKATENKGGNNVVFSLHLFYPSTRGYFLEEHILGEIKYKKIKCFKAEATFKVLIP